MALADHGQTICPARPLRATQPQSRGQIDLEDAAETKACIMHPGVFCHRPQEVIGTQRTNKSQAHVFHWESFPTRSVKPGSSSVQVAVRDVVANPSGHSGQVVMSSGEEPLVAGRRSRDTDTEPAQSGLTEAFRPLSQRHHFRRVEAEASGFALPPTRVTSFLSWTTTM